MGKNAVKRRVRTTVHVRNHRMRENYVNSVQPSQTNKSRYGYEPNHPNNILYNTITTVSKFRTKHPNETEMVERNRVCESQPTTGKESEYVGVSQKTREKQKIGTQSTGWERIIGHELSQ